MTDRTTVSTIGESIVIKGELSADEDVVIEGQLEGTINLNQNVLTVGEHGRVKANDRREDGSRCREGMGQHHSCRERRHPRHEFGGRRHFTRRGWRWPLAPMSAVASTHGSRKAESRPRRAPPTAAVDVPDKSRREGRSEAGVRPGDRRSPPEVVAAPSKRSWRSRWSGQLLLALTLLAGGARLRSRR